MIMIVMLMLINNDDGGYGDDYVYCWHVVCVHVNSFLRRCYTSIFNGRPIW